MAFIMEFRTTCKPRREEKFTCEFKGTLQMYHKYNPQWCLLYLWHRVIKCRAISKLLINNTKPGYEMK